MPAPLSDEPLEVDPEAAAQLADWYAFGAGGPRRVRDGTRRRSGCGPSTSTSRSSWTEVNYGFSPGDEHHAEPYAYVGPWTAEVSGELWNATGFRGAELTYAELHAAPDPHAAALDFFTTRKEALA